MTVSLARPEAEPRAEIGASGFGPTALNETPLPFNEAALEEFDVTLMKVTPGVAEMKPFLMLSVASAYVSARAHRKRARGGCINSVAHLVVGRNFLVHTRCR